MTKQQKIDLFNVYLEAIERKHPSLNTSEVITEDTITQEEMNTIIGEAINSNNVETANEIARLGTLVAIKTSFSELQSVTTDPLGEPIQNLDMGIVNGSQDGSEDGMYFYNGITWIKYVTGGDSGSDVIPTEEELSNAL